MVEVFLEAGKKRLSGDTESCNSKWSEDPPELDVIQDFFNWQLLGAWESLVDSYTDKAKQQFSFLC